MANGSVQENIFVYSKYIIIRYTNKGILTMCLSRTSHPTVCSTCTLKTQPPETPIWGPECPCYQPALPEGTNNGLGVNRLLINRLLFSKWQNPVRTKQKRLEKKPAKSKSKSFINS